MASAIILGALLVLVVLVIMSVSSRTSGRARADEMNRRYEADRTRRERDARAEKRLLSQEQGERAIVWLLKYIAKADRRNAVGEDQLIRTQIAELFPEERRLSVQLWVNNLRVDSAPDYETMVSRVVGLPLERREAAYEALASMATADGKATKSETTRLAAIRERLGLDD